MDRWKVTFKRTGPGWSPETIDIYADGIGEAVRRAPIAIELSEGRFNFEVTKLEKLNV
jgi:hypothetical protein